MRALLVINKLCCTNHGGKFQKTFLYGDTDLHHVYSGEPMILYNNCKKYCTIVPAFLFPNDICEEAVDEDLDNSFCVLIPKEFQSIGYFLYEERFVKRRNIHVYKYF